MAEDARWHLDAGRREIDGFDVDLDLNLRTPQADAATLEKLSVILAQLGAVHEQVRAAIERDFSTLPLIKDYLIPELFGLEEPYRALLFPNAVDVDDVTPDSFFHALTLCRVGYYEYPVGSGPGTDEVLIVDYRFLVGELTADDVKRHEVFLRFGSKYDITNQVVTARVAMDGTLIDLSVES